MEEPGSTAQLAQDEHALAMHRDRVIAGLDTMFHRYPDLGQAAGTRLGAAVTTHLTNTTAVSRRDIREKLAILPIARQVALDRMAGPTVWEGASDIRIDPRNPPAGFDPWAWRKKLPLPIWIQRVFEATGRFDENLGRLFWSLVGFMRSAHTGQSGSACLDARIDLRAATAIEAYVHVFSQPYTDAERGRYEGAPVEVVKAELDPDREMPPGDSPFYFLRSRAMAALDEKPGLKRTSVQWWDMGLMSLLLLDPNFSAESVGLKSIPSWDCGPESWGRQDVIGYLGWSDSEDKLEAAWWRLAEQALVHFRHHTEGSISPASSTQTHSIAPSTGPSVRRLGADPERLKNLERDTPPLDQSNGTWKRLKVAAALEGLTPATLGKYRNEGIWDEPRMLGCDCYGRVWRRVGTEKSHPWYLSATLKSKAKQDG